ncbi:MAG: hypothetical protein Hens2KO_10700 [Henriciella sp.]
MIAVIKVIFYLGPLIFGLGFLAPLSAQIIHAMGWTPPFGLTPLIAGLIIGGGLGLIAQIRGTWV